MKCSTVELIEVMLEETSVHSPMIKKGLKDTLDQNQLLETMHYFNKMAKNAIVKDKEMDDDAERGLFRAYHILVSLSDKPSIGIYSVTHLYTSLTHVHMHTHINVHTESLSHYGDKDKAEDNKELLKRCAEQSYTIEIHYQDPDESVKPILSKIRFRYDPEVSLIKQTGTWLDSCFVFSEPFKGGTD